MIFITANGCGGSLGPPRTFAVGEQEFFDLRFGNLSPGALTHSVKLQTADTDACEALHFKAELVEHVSDLTLQPLLEHDVN